MMKKLLSILLCVLLAASLSAVAVFAADPEEEATCDATLVGYQNPIDGYGVRIVAEVKNVDNYSEVGFVLHNGTSEKTHAATSVFKTLTANDGQGNTYEALTAAEGNYLYALAFKGIAAEDALTLTVTPYTVSKDGTTTVRGEEKTLVKAAGEHFTAKTDPSKYAVKNGGFETGDLTGWTLTGNFGVVSDDDTYWGGSYDKSEGSTYLFTWYTTEGDVSREDEDGTLVSDPFTLQKNAYVTFRLAGGNRSEIRVEFVNAETEEIIGQFFNTNANGGHLISYAYTFSNTEELSCYIRVVDDTTREGGWGCLAVDDFVTYYPAGETLGGAVTAVNAVDLKATLGAEIAADRLTAQGDYTADSYRAYTEALASAEDKCDAVVLPATLQAALTALRDAKAALTYRVPTEVLGVQKNFTLRTGGSRTFLFSDLVDEDALSEITYAVSSGEGVTVTLVDGGFTLTAGNTGAENVPVTLTVSHRGTAVLTVTLTVNVTADTVPTVNTAYVSRDIDFYDATEADLLIDLLASVNNPGDLALTFTVTHGGVPVALTDGTKFTFAVAGPYTATPTAVVYHIEVAYTANGTSATLTFDYTVNVRDTTGYRVTNGGFETGDLTGWTLVNSKIGAVSDASRYWLNDSENADGFSFGKDGKWFFNAYATDVESATGVLTSSSFVIGNSGWLTFKIGAARHVTQVWIDVYDAETGEILERFGNTAWQERTDGVKSGCSLIAYKADLSAYLGRTVKIRVVDNAATNDYSLFFVDSFDAWHDAEPDDTYLTAVPQTHASSIYEVENGGFETGNLDHWLLDGDIGVVTDQSRFWNHESNAGTEYNKDGNYLFSWWTRNDDGSENNREGNTGTLISGLFVLKENGIFTFKFGGGNGNQEVYIEVVNADTGEVMGKFFNTNGTDGILIQYSYQFDNTSDVNCYIRVVDNAASGWGCLAVDSFVANASERIGLTATNQK